MSDRYNIWDEGEYNYAGAFGFTPNIRAYVHEDENTRPCMLVIPGGGYRVASPTEGEIVAKKFYDAGFQAFVLTYTTNVLGIAPLKMQPLQDISRAVRFIRKKKVDFKLQEENVFVCGFSAGAHLTGSLAVHWMDVDDQNEAYEKISNRPKGVVLSYPVITSGEKAHRDSFTALCGEPTQEELFYFSLEKQVTLDTPPVFMWQTVTDQTVPVENSLLMANALKEAGVSFEYHLFPKGAHGLSLSNEAWERAEFGEPYTMEQTMNIVNAVKADILPLPEEAKKQFLDAFAYMDPEQQDPANPPAVGVAMKDVSVWPDLCVTWMKEVMGE